MKKMKRTKIAGQNSASIVYHGSIESFLFTKWSTKKLAYQI